MGLMSLSTVLAMVYLSVHKNSCVTLLSTHRRKTHPPQGNNPNNHPVPASRLKSSFLDDTECSLFGPDATPHGLMTYDLKRLALCPSYTRHIMVGWGCTMAMSSSFRKTDEWGTVTSLMGRLKPSPCWMLSKLPEPGALG